MGDLLYAEEEMKRGDHLVDVARALRASNIAILRWRDGAAEEECPKVRWPIISNLNKNKC